MQSAKATKSHPAAPLILDPKHPGINDPEYIARRQQLYELAYDYRVGEKGWPRVEYTEAEHALWRSVSERLVGIHERVACGIYREGKRLLAIESEHMPQLGALDRILRERHNFGLVPAEGLIDVELFFNYLKDRRMPCTQFLRHGAVPQFTPEPDAVHDVLGHVPCLMSTQYTEVVQQIGEGVLTCAKADMASWSRVYWFSIEFGLIEETSGIKVFGSGLLSSLEEMEYCYSDAVRRRPWVLEEVIATDYDPSRMQDTLFVIPSLGKLREDVAQLRRMTLP